MIQRYLVAFFAFSGSPVAVINMSPTIQTQITANIAVISIPFSMIREKKYVTPRSHSNESILLLPGSCVNSGSVSDISAPAVGNKSTPRIQKMTM